MNKLVIGLLALFVGVSVATSSVHFRNNSGSHGQVSASLGSSHNSPSRGALKRAASATPSPVHPSFMSAPPFLTSPTPLPVTNAPNSPYIWESAWSGTPYGDVYTGRERDDASAGVIAWGGYNMHVFSVPGTGAIAIMGVTGDHIDVRNSHGAQGVLRIHNIPSIDWTK